MTSAYSYSDAIHWIQGCKRIAPMERWSLDYFKKQTYDAIRMMRKAKCSKSEIEKAKAYRKKQIQWYIDH